MEVPLNLGFPALYNTINAKHGTDIILVDDQIINLPTEYTTDIPKFVESLNKKLNHTFVRIIPHKKTKYYRFKNISRDRGVSVLFPTKNVQKIFFWPSQVAGFVLAPGFLSTKLDILPDLGIRRYRIYFGNGVYVETKVPKNKSDVFIHLNKNLPCIPRIYNGVAMIKMTCKRRKAWTKLENISPKFLIYVSFRLKSIPFTEIIPWQIK
nr:hypothetical protein [Abalone asfa-like virus]